jgi:hypothetical protein
MLREWLYKHERNRDGLDDGLIPEEEETLKSIFGVSERSDPTQHVVCFPVRTFPASP